MEDGGGRYTELFFAAYAIIVSVIAKRIRWEYSEVLGKISANLSWIVGDAKIWICSDAAGGQSGRNKQERRFGW
jgi:hypothetical protein